MSRHTFLCTVVFVCILGAFKGVIQLLCTSHFGRIGVALTLLAGCLLALAYVASLMIERVWRLSGVVAGRLLDALKHDASAANVAVNHNIGEGTL
jgi:hypothetical protein